MGVGVLWSARYWQKWCRRTFLAMKFAQPKVLLEGHGLDGFYHHGAHVFDDDGDTAAWASDGLVWVVCRGGLNVAQDTGKAKGVPAFADASADKVTEADRTCNIVFADGYTLLDHSH